MHNGGNIPNATETWTKINMQIYLFQCSKELESTDIMFW